MQQLHGYRLLGNGATVSEELNVPAIPGMVCKARIVAFHCSSNVAQGPIAAAAYLSMGVSHNALPAVSHENILGIADDIWVRSGAGPLVVPVLDYAFVGNQFFSARNDLGGDAHVAVDIYFEWEAVSLEEWEVVARRNKPEGVP